MQYGVRNLSISLLLTLQVTTRIVRRAYFQTYQMIYRECIYLILMRMESFRSLGLSGASGYTAQRVVGAGIVLVCIPYWYDIAEYAMDRSRKVHWGLGT